MHRCDNPDHPHCTLWVMPGDGACAHGHAQAVAGAAAGSAAKRGGIVPLAGSAIAAPSIPGRPTLHVSGFDPRAAGGRQLLKLELRGMPADCASRLALRAASRLHLDGGVDHAFARTPRGDWLPVFLEFSSRELLHGQYRIALELRSPAQDGMLERAWVATLLVLVPRHDASLHEIHQTFLATHKNVRVHADDASIARVAGRLGGGRVDIDVRAHNAGIAHLDLDAADGKNELGLSSIAWDEALIEVPAAALPELAFSAAPAALPVRARGHACPAGAASIVGTAPGAARHLRLFARDEFVLGRLEPGSAADILLAHHSRTGIDAAGLTRRLSARHALVRRGRAGYEIEDVSRYGLLVDGSWPGKHRPVPLRHGMRIELTASISGIVTLEVAALLPNGVVLQRCDAGAAHEAFWLLEPEHPPGRDTPPHPGGLLLFHRDGGFWHRDAASGLETQLGPAMATAGLAGWPMGARYRTEPYPDLRRTPQHAAREAGAYVASL